MTHLWQGLQRGRPLGPTLKSLEDQLAMGEMQAVQGREHQLDQLARALRSRKLRMSIPSVIGQSSTLTCHLLPCRAAEPTDRLRAPVPPIIQRRGFQLPLANASPVYSSIE